jgi:hypothetical protein
MYVYICYFGKVKINALINVVNGNEAKILIWTEDLDATFFLVNMNENKITITKCGYQM